MPREPATVVVVADPFPLLATGIAAALSDDVGIRPVVVEWDPATLGSSALGHEADLLLLGVAEGISSWLDACARLRRRRPRCRVLLAVDPGMQLEMIQVVRAGITGVVLRSASPAEIVAASRAVVAGRSVVPPEVAGDLMRALAVSVSQSEVNPSAGALTAREVEVLRLVADGLTNRDIGSALHISENTVKNHLRRVHEKLGVRSRTEAVMSAARAGMIGLTDLPSQPFG